ncbi:HSA family protein [Babesia caballi]|uniref:HSA family protein n=1 Tax=Babesia caballi TaxID=5871 RepID=A0AAV4LTS0_BABCB|nr:HSA family protein [Babesia caballi]
MADEGRPGGAQAAAAPEAGAAKSAELASRAMGMLNASLIVTLPEPAQRSRSYRELILQEMNWMACDYYHERRWKVHAGKQLCIGIKEAAMDRKRLNKNWIASECSLHVKRFWTAVLANSQEETPVSAELAHYCARIARGYRNHVQTDTGDVSRDYDIGERDLIAVTVPPMQQPDGHAYSTRSLEHKNEVLETTILGMQSMGAELYRPIFRPPDDDLDMFTMPLMDPLRDNDFNALLVQNFCLKYCEQPHALARAKEELRSPSVPDITRRFNRPANEASCLAMSVRDFDLQIKPKPPFLGAMVKTQLTSVEFELLDSWMISEATSWPMIAICLTYRSSASGLHRFEYSAEYCKEVFEQFNRQPRGLVNSSRRLLGPRQRNAITTFLDAPPPRLKFRALLDSADQGETAVRREVGLPVGSGKRYAGYCSVGSASLRRVRQRGATRSRGLRALYLAHRALVNEGRGGQSGIVQGDDVDMAMEGSEGVEEHVGDSDGGFRVLGDSKSVDGESVSTESSELQVKLPLLDVKSSDLETMSVVVVHKEASAAVEPNGQSCRGDDGLREGSTAEGKVEGEALGKVVAVPKDAYVEVAMATGKNKAAKCYDKQLAAGDGAQAGRARRAAAQAVHGRGRGRCVQEDQEPLGAAARRGAGGVRGHEGGQGRDEAAGGADGGQDSHQAHRAGRAQHEPGAAPAAAAASAASDGPDSAGAVHVADAADADAGGQRVSALEGVHADDAPGHAPAAHQPRADADRAGAADAAAARADGAGDEAVGGHDAGVQRCGAHDAWADDAGADGQHEGAAEADDTGADGQHKGAAGRVGAGADGQREGASGDAAAAAAGQGAAGADAPGADEAPAAHGHGGQAAAHDAALRANVPAAGQRAALPVQARAGREHAAGAHVPHAHVQQAGAVPQGARGPVPRAGPGSRGLVGGLADARGGGAEDGGEGGGGPADEQQGGRADYGAAEAGRGDLGHDVFPLAADADVHEPVVDDVHPVGVGALAEDGLVHLALAHDAGAGNALDVGGVQALQAGDLAEEDGNDGHALGANGDHGRHGLVEECAGHVAEQRAAALGDLVGADRPLALLEAVEAEPAAGTEVGGGGLGVEVGRVGGLDGAGEDDVEGEAPGVLGHNDAAALLLDVHEERGDEPLLDHGEHFEVGLRPDGGEDDGVDVHGQLLPGGVHLGDVHAVLEDVEDADVAVRELLVELLVLVGAPVAGHLVVVGNGHGFLLAGHVESPVAAHELQHGDHRHVAVATDVQLLEYNGRVVLGDADVRGQQREVRLGAGGADFERAELLLEGHAGTAVDVLQPGAEVLGSGDALAAVPVEGRDGHDVPVGFLQSVEEEGQLVLLNGRDAHLLDPVVEAGPEDDAAVVAVHEVEGGAQRGALALEGGDEEVLGCFQLVLFVKLGGVAVVSFGISQAHRGIEVVAGNGVVVVASGASGVELGVVGGFRIGHFGEQLGGDCGFGLARALGEEAGGEAFPLAGAGLLVNALAFFRVVILGDVRFETVGWLRCVAAAIRQFGHVAPEAFEAVARK